MLQEKTVNNESMELEEKQSSPDELESHIENPPPAATPAADEAQITFKTWSVILVGEH